MYLLYKLRYILFIFLIAPAFFEAPKEYLSLLLILGIAVLLTKVYDALKK